MGKDIRRVKSHDGCPYDASHPKRTIRLVISRHSLQANSQPESSSQASSAPSSPLPFTAPPPSPSLSESLSDLTIQDQFTHLSLNEPTAPTAPTAPTEPNAEANQPLEPVVTPPVAEPAAPAPPLRLWGFVAHVPGLPVIPASPPRIYEGPITYMQHLQLQLAAVDTAMQPEAGPSAATSQAIDVEPVVEQAELEVGDGNGDTDIEDEEAMLAALAKQGNYPFYVPRG
ncbi:hypothetical protein SISSUDRAFT_1058698 [Sistotremastrum suecicum HHB10207 ss-3]|uniref:Uncharacterized protein n=1 Tax=Sistotremastrum suecicum HHB10207 ss-3 TaxID=1314776 RepID=A0A166H4V3_9AGAM|nr:hypothetical protein SISSUDRAFT_1058698 [Sistotremastrum suecicum HHB10207 ss-3]